MDNRVNEIRREISALRAQMSEAEAVVRDRLKLGVDCAPMALHQLTLRRDLARAIEDWKAAGGSEPALSPRSRLHRAVSPGRDGKVVRILAQR